MSEIQKENSFFFSFPNGSTFDGTSEVQIISEKGIVKSEEFAAALAFFRVKVPMAEALMYKKTVNLKKSGSKVLQSQLFIVILPPTTKLHLTTN